MLAEAYLLLGLAGLWAVRCRAAASYIFKTPLILAAMTPVLRYNLAMVGLAAALSGCGAGGEPRGGDAVVVDGATAFAPIDPTPPRVAAAPAIAPALAEPKGLAPQVADFTPPFPERIELFQPPKRAETSGRRGEEYSDVVELKGFINVDEPRAVIAIDGVVAPIAEGGEKFGVQVIRIQPPSVDLRRNGRNWRATLE